MREFSRWCVLEWCLPSHRLPAPGKTLQTSSLQYNVIVRRWSLMARWDCGRLWVLTVTSKGPRRNTFWKASGLWNASCQEPTPWSRALLPPSLDWISARQVLIQAQPWTESRASPGELRNTHLKENLRLCCKRTTEEGCRAFRSQSKSAPVD